MPIPVPYCTGRHRADIPTPLNRIATMELIALMLVLVGVPLAAYVCAKD